MDVIRRNTDYAIRMMVNLAKRFGKEAVSSRVLAGEDDVSYQLACKLLQKLNRAKLVKSQMGPKGGFCLAKKPTEISLGKIVESIQGPLSVNCCVLDPKSCERQPDCPVNRKLVELQDKIDGFFCNITLNKLIQNGSVKNRKHKKGRS